MFANSDLGVGFASIKSSCTGMKREGTVQKNAGKMLCFTQIRTFSLPLMGDETIQCQHR
jgi:hypothetical protein